MLWPVEGAKVLLHRRSSSRGASDVKLVAFFLSQQTPKAPKEKLDAPLVTES